MRQAYRDGSAAARERFEERRTALAARLERCSPWLLEQLSREERVAIDVLRNALVSPAATVEEIARLEANLEAGDGALARAEALAPGLERLLSSAPEQPPQPTEPVEPWGPVGIEVVTAQLKTKIAFGLADHGLRPEITVHGTRIDVAFRVSGVPVLWELEIETWKGLGFAVDPEGRPVAPPIWALDSRVHVRVSSATAPCTLSPRSKLVRWFHAFVRAHEADEDPLASFVLKGNAAFAELLFVGELRLALRGALRIGATLSIAEGTATLHYRSSQRALTGNAIAAAELLLLLRAETANVRLLTAP